MPEAQLRRHRVLEPVLALVAKEALTASLDVLPHELRDDLGERLRVLLIQRDSENFVVAHEQRNLDHHSRPR